MGRNGPEKQACAPTPVSWVGWGGSSLYRLLSANTGGGRGGKEKTAASSQSAGARLKMGRAGPEEGPSGSLEIEWGGCRRRGKK